MRKSSFSSEGGRQVIIALFALGAAVGIGSLAVRSPSPSRRESPYIRTSVPRGVALQGVNVHLGSSRTPTQLVVFSDFECQYCKTLHGTLLRLRQKSSDSITVIWRHYPLATHPTAMRAALAAECGSRRGFGEQMTAALFERQDSLGKISLVDLAGELGISDSSWFERCLTDPSSREVIDDDIRVGQRLNIQGTPMMVVEGLALTGAAPLDTVQAFIRESKKRVGL